MMKAHIQISPFYLFLKIFDDCSEKKDTILKKKTMCRLILAEYFESQDYLDEQMNTEKILNDYFTEIQKHKIKDIEISADPCLQDLRIFNILRLFLKTEHNVRLGVKTAKETADSLFENYPVPRSSFLIFNLGECDCKFYLGKNSNIDLSFQFPINFVELSNNIKTNPPEPSEIIALRELFSKEFESFEIITPPENIYIISDVGIALADFIEQTNKHRMSLTKLQKHIPTLTTNYHAKLLKTSGIDKNYLPIFIPAAIFFQHLMDFLKVDELKLYAS